MDHLAHVSFGSLYEEVVVGGHEYITVKSVSVFVLCFKKVFLELVIIAFAKEDPLPLISASGHMIEGPFVFNPQRPSQDPPPKQNASPN